MTQRMETQQKKALRIGDGDEPFAGRHVHMIGIGGSGMRALARMLMGRGAVVTGSDMAESDATRGLLKDGAGIRIGQSGENIPADCDLVVYTVAVHEQNPELVAARQRGIETIKYSQMLGRAMQGRTGIAIAGTHGKSTTSAMVAFALTEAGVDPSYIVGAHVEQLGGPCGVGLGPHFVAEACEFDRSFLSLRPRLATILNLEEDHLDCYRDLEAIIEAFKAFASLVPPDGALIVNGEDRSALTAARAAVCPVETFGMAEGCTWRAVDVQVEHGRYRFAIERGGSLFCRVASRLPGLHNAYNTLAAAGLLHRAGIDPQRIGEVLSQFTGTRRRMTDKGEVGGVRVVDDFAHHPTEIQATLRALREFYEPRRLLCAFQPHQHSRTRFLLKDFARSFGAADEVVVPDIYFVRDSDREKDYISSQDLVSQIRLHGGSAQYIRTLDQIAAHLLERAAPGDLVVTMGAGNIWEVADELVRRLG